jgi:hypothetical protein
MSMMPRYQPGTIMPPGMVQMTQPMVTRPMVSVTAPPVSSATGSLHCKFIDYHTR